MRFFFKPDMFVILMSTLGVFLLTYLWMSAGTLVSITFWVSVAVSLFMAWFVAKMPLFTYVDEDVIKVQQLIGSTTFRRSEVTVKRLTSRDMEGLIRSFGSGGLAGYIGYFQNARLGRFYMLALSRNNLALLTLADGKKFVIHFPPQK